MAGAKDMWKKFLSSMNRGFTANPSITIFIIVSLVIHFLDVFSDFRNTNFRIFAYLILTIAAWLSLFKDQENPGVIDVANIKVPIILSSIAIFAPYLGGIIPFLGNSQAFQTAIIFFPVWILYLCFCMGQNWFIIICRWGIVLLLLFLVLPAILNGFINDLGIGDIETGINVQQTISNVGRDLSYSINTAAESVKKSWTNMWKNLIKTATGDYYTGKVDEYEHEPVGVYLEDLEAADSKFFEGEKITVWAVLKAKTLDNEININVSCYAKEGDKKIKGDITPQNEFNIATEEEEYLDCTFDKLNPGKRDVTFNAEFNFETMAYLKTYFMDKERLRAFKRDGIDVFSHYKISHINPIAIYTNGPIGIGMRTAEPLPVGVYSDKDNIPFFFGITIENNWEGIIRKVTDLEVQVHDSLELTNCDHEFEFKENEDGYNIYSLVLDKRTENITNYHSIKCRLYPLDSRSLLGNEPITTRYFRVTANYIYELEKSTPVEIEDVEDYKSPEEAMTSEEEAQEFEDKLNEKVDEKTNKEIACDAISKCSDYDANYYDKLGFNDQTWCDTNPCSLDCYSCFKKEKLVTNKDIYYDSCKKCPYYTTIQGMPSEDYCNIYLTEDYCKKDSCEFWNKYNFKCEWMEDVSLCKGIESKTEKIEDWREEDDVKLKIRGAAIEYDVPESFALGIAQQESGMEHYDTYRRTKIVKFHTANKQGIIGIMQVALDKNSDYCSPCSKTKEELKDIDINIECGMKILKGKYNTFCEEDGTIKMRSDGKSIFEHSVTDCPQYLKYKNNCWNMAIRAYNGLGCIPPPEGSADIDYVENVRDKIEEFGFD